MDFHEERKRQRTFAFLFANCSKVKIGEKIAKNCAIDALYKNCYTLYSSINQGNNLSEFSEENKNTFNDLLKPNNFNEYESMKEELVNWEKQIKNLENRLNELKTKIKLEGENIQKFLEIFSLIKSIINNQEEKIKEMQISKNKEKMPDMELGLSGFANYLKDSNNFISRENRNATIIADKSNINYNKVNNNISEIIKQVVEEFNKQILSVVEANISKSKTQNNNNNINNEENMNNNMEIENMKTEEEEFDLMLNKGLNPAKLLLNIKEEMSQEDLIKSFKAYLEIENCFVLPVYNYHKLLKSKLDLNSVQYDPSNAFFNIFPSIENDDKKFAAKKLMEVLDTSNNMNNSNNINKKKNNEMIIEKTVKYDQLTPLQKLVILYGIFASGNNPSIVNCILNMYSPTHCVMYNNEEMSYICGKILEEVDISYESNFCNMKDEEIFNFNKNEKFYLNNSQKVDIESSLFITEFNDFKYNDTIRKIYNLKDDKKGEEFSKIFHEIKNQDQYKLNSEFNIKNKNISLQKSINLIKILTNNPYIKNPEAKKKFLSEILQYLRSFTKKIKQFQESNISKYNYFTGEPLLGNKRKINDMNYPEIIQNKKKKLDKDSVLNLLRENKNNIKYKCKSYSIKEIKKEIIKEDENNRDTSVKNKIINVINLYNPNNIKNEWERNRKEWYQNNQRFNPIFKINDRNNQEDRQRNLTQNFDSTTYVSRNNDNGDNNNGGGGPPNGRGGNGGGSGNNSKSNENNLCRIIPDIHSNQ